MRKNSNLPIDEKLEAAEFMLNNNLSIVNDINNNNKKGFYPKKIINAINNIKLEEEYYAIKLKKSLDILKNSIFIKFNNNYKIFYEKSIGYN